MQKHPRIRPSRKGHEDRGEKEFYTRLPRGSRNVQPSRRGRACPPVNQLLRWASAGETCRCSDGSFIAGLGANEQLARAAGGTWPCHETAVVGQSRVDELVRGGS